MNEIIFIGNARCYHTMDWYRNARSICAPRCVLFATDLIESEGHTRLVTDADDLVELYNIDWLLPATQSRVGNIWRNLVKLLVFPRQVLHTRSISRRIPGALFHAHAMYYLFVCWAAGVRYIGTPQGSEILVRPGRSRFYKYFAKKSLGAAKHVTVDSEAMRSGIWKLCRRESTIVQNGIDISAIRVRLANTNARAGVLSIRGMCPLYRIETILDARARCRSRPQITFIYPLWEDAYRETVRARLDDDDRDLGRLPRHEMYELLASAKLAISIPESDSSPRSVYEAIFCGCCVATTPSPWVEVLPECMRKRLVMVDLNDGLWIEKALKLSGAIVAQPYEPSELALKTFDQVRSMQAVADRCYSNSR